MRICIPTAANEGTEPTAVIFGHFGSAPRFIVYDTEKGSYEAIDNPETSHDHGHCDPVGTIERGSVDVLITAGIGQRAVELLRARNVKVLRTTPECTVAEVVDSYRKGELEEITLEGVCRH